MAVRLGINTLSGDGEPDPKKRTYNWVSETKKNLDEFPKLEALLIGDEKLIKNSLTRLRMQNYRNLEVVNVENHGLSLRDSSKNPKLPESIAYMLALHYLKNNNVDGVVSANDTTQIVMDAIRNIGRQKFFRAIPPLTTELPTGKRNKRTLFLEIGASLEDSLKDLLVYAKFGNIYAQNILGVNNPAIGLISNGEEDTKGTKFVQEANYVLKELLGQQQYLGQTEPSGEYGLFSGNTDVMIAPNGFIGNLILKSIEGTSKFMKNELKEMIWNPPEKTGIKFYGARSLRLLGYILAKGAFDDLKEKCDPANYNGTPFLGFKRPIFKCHGGAKPTAMGNAIRNSYEFLNEGKFEKINEQLATSLNK